MEHDNTFDRSGASIAKQLAAWVGIVSGAMALFWLAILNDGRALWASNHNAYRVYRSRFLSSVLWFKGIQRV